MIDSPTKANIILFCKDKGYVHNEYKDFMARNWQVLFDGVAQGVYKLDI
jgi:hypothetical protein